MIKGIQLPTALRLEEASSPALKNPAVIYCAGVWKSIHRQVLAKSKIEYAAENEAAKAYRAAMPALSGYRNVCDFIACVGYGMVIGAIGEKTSGKLLSAAHVALSAVPRQAAAPPPLPPFRYILMKTNKLRQ